MKEARFDVFMPPGTPEGALEERAAALLRVASDRVHVQVLRRSLDARKGRPLGFVLQVRCADEPLPPLALPTWPAVAPRPELRVVIVGTGPAGTFAALRLAGAGARATLVELGRPVPARRRDVAALLRAGRLDPASNYCFGEGGAGTFSDGKLHTRTKDRAAVAAVLGALVRFGADPDILVDSRPHVGSNRLPRVLLALRAHLETAGCEYRWSDPVVDLEVDAGRVVGVRLASGAVVAGDAVVLAGGHSARPLYEVLARRGVKLAAKGFAMGARIEHPQPLVDEMQYGRRGRAGLPPAFYEATARAAGRGVYSFCMCPGGWIVPSSTEPDALCTNGMSLSKRDSPLANAAMVVTVQPADFGGEPLRGIELQRSVERAAFALGGGGHRAPAQRAVDFVAGRASADLPATSYRPGVRPADLADALPPFVTVALREGLRAVGRRLHGFLGRDALLVGVETRTSAPVRVERHTETLESPSHPGLYPAGEGSGHAGGIVSSAIDGVRAAEAILARSGRR
ncbi:MAG: hypothetical protein HY906_01990 [Deltaproteobacteria bacterium]|nr:hypothetical protein [Deltaproteobacteria bacterium]